MSDVPLILLFAIASWRCISQAATSREARGFPHSNLLNIVASFQVYIRAGGLRRSRNVSLRGLQTRLVKYFILGGPQLLFSWKTIVLPSSAFCVVRTIGLFMSPVKFLCSPPNWIAMSVQTRLSLWPPSLTINNHRKGYQCIYRSVGSLISLSR